MNEKIKELISQSYEYAVVTTIDPFTSEVVTDFIDGTKPIFNAEKFAELIILECIGVFSKDLPDPTSPDYQLGSLPEVVNRIANVAEHFGVEE